MEKIFFEEELYPRNLYDWRTAYSYSEAMKSGAIFPPICICRYASKWLLIDGKHRLEAYKIIKAQNIKCELLKYKTRKDMFLEAIKRNISNGRRLSVYDKAMICGRLRNMKFKNSDISGIVEIPLNKITSFMKERITSDITGENVYLKSTVTNFSGQVVGEDFNNKQQIFDGTSQEIIIEQLITLLENDMINKKNKKLMNDLSKVYQLIRAYIMSNRRK